jgi:hypothetical protein
MAADEGAEGFGNGKSDQEVVAGQLLFKSFIQPFLVLLILALGAVPVAAGAKRPVCLAAVGALVEGQAAGVGSAGDHSLDDFAVLGGDAVLIAGQIFGAVGPEDIIDLSHDRVLP